MLKEKLKIINKKPLCVYGSFYSTLDKETRQVLDDVMSGESQTRDIFRALKSEGCTASETTLRRIRTDCYKSDTPCQCLQGENNA